MAENEPIRHSIILNPEDVRTKEIMVLQRVYPLDENNFNKLIKGPSGYKDWAQKVLFMSIGWAFKIISALIVFIIAYTTATSNDTVILEIKAWEIVSVGLALLVCLILYIIGHYFKNDKDKLIGIIELHFKNHQI